MAKQCQHEDDWTMSLSQASNWLTEIYTRKCETNVNILDLELACAQVTLFKVGRSSRQLRRFFGCTMGSETVEFRDQNENEFMMEGAQAALTAEIGDSADEIVRK